MLSVSSATVTLAQTGSVLAPVAPPRDQPAHPPAAAPRTPVRDMGSAKVPVVPPHGSNHPEKPILATPPKPPATPPPAAAPVAPAQPSTDVPPAQAEKLPDPEKPAGSVAKLPRFASLRSDDVNMRAGPGTRYRIEWVYRRRELPVQVDREFDVWRWVRDADGVQGWVNQATLTGRRTFIVHKAEATLRSDPNETASAVAILQPGVIGRIRSCEAASAWCNVQTGSYRGYLRRNQFWGAFADEAINP